MIAGIAAAWLGCSSAPAPVPTEPPPTGTVLVPHAPAVRPIPEDHPEDPALFTIGSDGLGIFDRVLGEGEPVVPGVVAVAEITSWTPDGARWDSTRERRDPARFVVGGEQVVPGWSTGILGMQPGGVRQLLVPPELGFPHGIAGRLPEGPTITQIELLQILVPPTAPVSDVPSIPVGDLGVRAVGGLDVRDVRPGSGPELVAGATARLDYVGWLADGTVFDSSYGRSSAFGFPYGRGLVRWEAALAGMRVGGRRQIEIPSELAFGVKGRPPVIPPGASLVLAVDLHAIE